MDHLLIVAGGGAGGERHLGGSGGGYKGTSGAYGYNNAVATPATGGTQTEGGTGATLAGDYQTQYGDGSPGVFGLGANSCLSGVCGGGAGGGGYFGGGSTVYVGGGGGGSGYIGNNSLFDKKMYCYKCEETPENDIRTLSTNSTSAEPRVNQAKEGNGFSRITLLKRTINQTALTLDFAFEEYLNGNEYTFSYTGDYQTFTVPKTGYYKVELWGSGGNDKAGSGGEGGYTSGKIYLVKGEKLYVYVGRKNQNTSKFNASNYTKYAVYSSGSTDIRTVSGNWDDFDSLKTRIMVAGAGGMAGGTNSTVSHPGGAGGGLVSYAGINGGAGAVAGGKATQISGQSFGLGNLTYHEWGAPGANGYFAGGSGSGGNDQGSAGGGSSFISGHAGCVAVKESSVSDNLIFNDDSNGVSCDSTDSSTFNSNGYNTDINCSKHYSNRIFTDTKMIDGKGYEWTTEVGTEVVGMPTQDGTSTMKGNTGNGFAKITFLEEIPEYTFDYTGDVQTFIAPYNGIYKVELWGASGYDFDEKEGGKGAYTSGTITLSKNTPLYLYVGGNARYNAYNGIDGPTGKTGDPSIAKDYGAGGGGSTDVRVVKSTWDNFESLKSRIMVAAGGGGVGTRGGGYGKWNGGDAGGLIGYDGIGVYLTETSTEDTGGYCNGASQIAGGHCYITYSQNNYYGMFGRTNAGLRLTGGSGYYAGAGAFHVSGSGGSSYISGHSGCVSITKESTQDNITFVNASNGV
ncbi:MAG: hypothetical protein IJ193_03915, partial [Bacilli bacterium]|nr:hypothetical protein [Bacilli bacterium]